MTDTTGIKALPKMTLDELLIRCTDYDDGSLSMDAGELKMLNQHISLLEAERQRADKANRTCSDLLRTATDEAMRANKAEAEIAELKGDQVPVAYTAARWLDTRCKLSVWTDRESAVMEIGDNSKVAELYNRPQKPVVLPVADHETEDGYKYYREETVKAAIEAAGGIVKVDL